ncbi:hypothetical protein DM791_12925 [Paenarthrobacter nitroguajacolicus]|nr:hypothetical protein [Paenarthrobacter nitroguajacolicus]NWL33793.1 hypothetical protein [Paenarthrobacter nitroguajacolicus]
MALTACGGGTPAPSSAPPSETATATPTPAKQYSTEELVEFAKQIKAADGSTRAAVSGQELVAQYDPLRALTQAAIEPTTCKDLGTLGVYQPIAGSTSAGTVRAKTGDFMTAVALTSGVERDVLQASLDTSKSQVEACGRMTISAEGQSITATTEKAEGIGSVPGTVSFKTVMAFPDGRTGTLFTANAIKDGVLISATASGNNGEAGGPEAAGALLDQAAALIK